MPDRASHESNERPAPSRAELERWVGAVVIPSLRPPGGLAPGAPLRAPSQAYLERFPPVCVIGFGRRLSDGATIPGLPAAIAALRARAVRPFAVACDLERGAGYHVPGRTALPPVRALAEACGPGTHHPLGVDADQLAPVEEAALLTGLEARADGIELVLAPVLDVNSNPRNPIIGARAFGTSPHTVANFGRAFLRGLARAGVGASLKHFPGHGDTHVDSHLALPRVQRRVDRYREQGGSAGGGGAEADGGQDFLTWSLAAYDRAEGMLALEGVELLPFREVLDAPEAAALGDALTVMVGHLDVPDLTGEPGLATTLAPATGHWLADAGFEGAVLTDGLEMLAVADELELGARALRAGCHGLLGPRDEAALAQELLDAVEAGRLDPAVLQEAAERMERLAAALLTPPFKEEAAPALGPIELALRALRAQPHATDFAGRYPNAELLGDADLIARLALPGAAPGPPLVVAGPRTALPKPLPAHPALWLGPPESVPKALRSRPYLWAWAADPVVAEALARFLAEPQDPRGPA